MISPYRASAHSADITDKSADIRSQALLLRGFSLPQIITIIVGKTLATITTLSEEMDAGDNLGLIFRTVAITGLSGGGYIIRCDLDLLARFDGVNLTLAGMLQSASARSPNAATGLTQVIWASEASVTSGGVTETVHQGTPANVDNVPIEAGRFLLVQRRYAPGGAPTGGNTIQLIYKG